MTIKKEGFLFKLVYGPESFRDWVAYDFDWFEAPEKTNICCLFWRLILSIFLIYPLIALVGLVVISATLTGGLIVFAAVVPLAWLTGFLFCLWIYPNFDKNNPSLSKLVLVPFKNWPLEFRGHKVYPISIITLLAITTGLIWSFVKWWEVLLCGLPALGLLCLLIYFLPDRFTKFRQSEFWQLIKAYCKAKKERVCPIVTFE